MTAIVYTSDNCSKCRMTKLLLIELEVAIEERNITHNEGYYKEAKELSDKTGYTSMPIVLIDNSEPVFGFEPDVITDLVS